MSVEMICRMIKTHTLYTASVPSADRAQNRRIVLVVSGRVVAVDHHPAAWLLMPDFVWVAARQEEWRKVRHIAFHYGCHFIYWQESTNASERRLRYYGWMLSHPFQDCRVNLMGARLSWALMTKCRFGPRARAHARTHTFTIHIKRDRQFWAIDESQLKDKLTDRACGRLHKPNAVRKQIYVYLLFMYSIIAHEKFSSRWQSVLIAESFPFH